MLFSDISVVTHSDLLDTAALVNYYHFRYLRSYHIVKVLGISGVLVRLTT